MSQKLVGRNPALKRLRDEGYDIQVVGTHLVISGIPYVTSAREVKRGFLLTTLEMQGDVVQQPQEHWVWFGGECPCTKQGVALDNIIISRQKQTLAKDIAVDFQFSTKPWDTKRYADYYVKVTTYIKILCHEAQAIDPNVTAQIYPAIPVDDDDDSPFQYFDTASSRAGIEAVSYKLAMRDLAILGLGGTGAYILDQVAKTRAAKIHIYDDDEFSQHTAFRAPGAFTLDEIKPDLTKVAHYVRVYTKIHKGIVPHPYRITAENAQELTQMQFVFLCLDSGEQKDAIMRTLEDAGVPFIDVGMGLQKVNGALCGILRATTSTSKKQGHIRGNQRISFAPALGPNEYSRNIQVADLNALNAMLAVIKWKKICGFYHDLSGEHHTTYVIETNKLGSEDL